MNIALIVHELHEYGGHSLYTRVLADAFADRHEVTIFANRCERRSEARWHFQHIPAWRRNALSTVQTFPLGLACQRRKLAGFQIQHSQGYCGGRPNVVTAHICAAAYRESLRESGLKTQISLSLMEAAESRFYRRFNGHIIAISKMVACDLRERYGVNGPISVIPHGIDTQRFNSGNRQRYRRIVREALSLKDGHIVALYVGDLIKAHAYLRELASATPDVQFLIVTRSQKYHPQTPNVSVLPPTAQIERYYAAADAFVFPTTYDAFGMVVLEAMASGLAVFTSDRAGAAELVSTGHDGVVLGLKDWVAGARAGLRDYAKLAALGQAAEQSAQQHHWNQVVEKVEGVYMQTLDS